MKNKYRVFVDGQEGTTGLRIHEYLAQRDDMDVMRIDPDQRKNVDERARLLNASDVAFLCLPDAASREAAALVTNPTTCVIDASTAHRVAGGWAYGLPELAPGQRELLRRTKRISTPGCHATAFVVLVRPLLDAGWLPADLPVSATSITGYSGGGKKMIEQYEAGGDPRLAAPRPYALTLAHKHVDEMKVHGGLTHAPIFIPVVGPYFQGLAVSIPLHLRSLPVGCTPASIQQALEARYAEERFIRVMPLRDAAVLEDGYFDVQGANATNRVDIFVFANDSQLVLMGRLDNLGKGASGAAVQSMNIHLGLEEASGL